MSSIKKNFIYNSLYQLLTLFLPLITIPYLSRMIGADGIGVYSYNYSIANYFVLFIMLGLNNYGNRTVAKLRDDKRLLSENFSNIYCIQLTLGVILTALYFLYSLSIAEDTNIALVMSLLLFSGILDINWFFFGIEKFKLVSIRNIVVKLVATILIFTLVKSQEDIALYCAIIVGSILISNIYVWLYLPKEINFIRPKWKNVKPHIKPNFFLFFTVIAVSLFKIMDKILLGSLANLEQVGFYELSERLISIPISLVVSLGTVMLPRMTNLLANKSKGISELLEHSIMFAMFLSSSLAFGIMGVSQEFVPLFYGEGFDTIKYIILIIMPTCLFIAFGNVIRTQYLLPHQKDSIYVGSAVLGALISITVNVLLIPQLMSIGSAIATVFAEFGVCFYQCYKIRKEIDIYKYMRLSIPFIGSGLIMFLLIYFLNLCDTVLFNLLFKILIGFLTYIVFLSILLYFFYKETFYLIKVKLI